ncbi:MAG TPA: PhoH family protein [Polyangiaceae bacterium]|nr:PhoH family protein [Polyangiaceae bacterium]
MKKNYILDTNVLLHDPHAFYKFEDNDVLLPIYVIEEIDQFKRDTNERGRNARTVSRLLDALREKNGSLSEGVELDDGGTLRVHVPTRRPELSIALNPKSGDHAILQTAIEFRDASPDKPTIFVTMDVNLRIRADALGLTTETYENQAVDIDELKSGIVELEVAPAELDAFFDGAGMAPPAGQPLYANVSVVLRDTSTRKRTALGRYAGDKNLIVPLKLSKEGIMGIRARNKEQSFALDLLMDDSVKLVTVMGKAGTGKTLLALAAGLQRTAQDGAYSRLLISRPIMPLGRDLGYLPGDVEEKLNPWMQPLYDNLDFLMVAEGKRRGMRGLEHLFEKGLLQIEPLTYIRGRSLPQQFVIVDEAQNLTPHEVKTVITRCGEGTKIVLTGDPFQIDNPYVDAATNGLTVSADRLQGEGLVGHILLSRGERSELSNIAANKL